MTRKDVIAYYLGPVVKPRDDKKGELCSAGPRPRDDKFLSFLFCSLFKKKERCVILGLDPRIQVNKVARMRACIIFKVQSANVVSLRDKFYYLGPVVKPRDDKKDVIDITWVPWSSHGMTRKENCVVRGPGHGMTRKENCVVRGPGHGMTSFSLLFFFLKTITK